MSRFIASDPFGDDQIQGCANVTALLSVLRQLPELSDHDDVEASAIRGSSRWVTATLGAAALSFPLLPYPRRRVLARTRNHSR
jgi:hypothetical protein